MRIFFGISFIFPNSVILNDNVRLITFSIHFRIFPSIINATKLLHTDVWERRLNKTFVYFIAEIYLDLVLFGMRLVRRVFIFVDFNVPFFTIIYNFIEYNWKFEGMILWLLWRTPIIINIYSRNFDRKNVNKKKKNTKMGSLLKNSDKSRVFVVFAKSKKKKTSNVYFVIIPIRTRI